MAEVSIQGQAAATSLAATSNSTSPSPTTENGDAPAAATGGTMYMPDGPPPAPDPVAELRALLAKLTSMIDRIGTPRPAAAPPTVATGQVVGSLGPQSVKVEDAIASYGSEQDAIAAAKEWSASHGGEATAVIRTVDPVNTLPGGNNNKAGLDHTLIGHSMPVRYNVVTLDPAIAPDHADQLSRTANPRSFRSAQIVDLVQGDTVGHVGPGMPPPPPWGTHPPLPTFPPFPRTPVTPPGGGCHTPSSPAVPPRERRTDYLAEIADQVVQAK